MRNHMASDKWPKNESTEQMGMIIQKLNKISQLKSELTLLSKVK